MVMTLKSFDTILEELCTYFDSLIAPRKIARANSNIIYLILKAIAKGYEVINNLVVSLNNKFDPATCAEEDLESVAWLVGTERLKGASSGLSVSVVNNKDDESIELPAGTYTYKLNDETIFSSLYSEPKIVPPLGTVQLILLSEKVGVYQVTAQPSITVTAVDLDGNKITFAPGLTFACANNAALLGYEDETNLEFRKRIIEDTERQDIVNEIKLKIKNLPYVYDCNIYFNQNIVDYTYDGYTVPPFYMLVMVSGEARDGIADIVAKNGIYPTVKTDETFYSIYHNDVFAPLPFVEDPLKRRGYKVWLTHYRTFDFSVEVLFYADDNYISEELAKEKIRAGLFITVNGNKHVDIITENDIFNYVQSLNIIGVKVLGVNMYTPESDVVQNYISIPQTRIPNLTAVTATAQRV